MKPAWAAHLRTGVSPGSVDLTARGSLPVAWRAAWAAAPDRITLTDERGRSMSAGQLEESSRTVAGRFAAAGLTAGDRVLMSAETSIELVVAHVAALRAGLVVVPANTTYREREIAHLVTDAGPRLAVVDRADRARWVATAAPSTIITGPDIGLAPGPPPTDLDRPAPSDPALIGYTSGTTGAPKGAVLSRQPPGRFVVGRVGLAVDRR